MVNQGGYSERLFKYPFLVVLIFLFGPLTIISAQNLKMCGYQGYQTVEEVNSACELQQAQMALGESDLAVAVVDEILDKIGLFRNFLIEECIDINNALAVTMPIENGDLERYILYDSKFFQKVNVSTGTDWGLTSILAHEVGHHLNGHTLKSGGSNHKVELQADEFSGFVLARMGCSLKNAQSAINKLLPDNASATHPAKKDRLKAVEKGWKRGNGNIIEIKKIENIDDNDKITSEMILANYINAIGGEKKIRTIKTLKIFQSNTLQNSTKPILENSRKTVSERAYLSPSIFRVEQEFAGNKTLMISNLRGTYFKMPGSDWLASNTKNTEEKNKDVAYIEEYSWFVNNAPIEYKGIEEINHTAYYVLEIDQNKVKYITNEWWEQEILKEEKIKLFFDVKTGLKRFVEKNNTTKSTIIDNLERKSIHTSSSASKIEIFEFKSFDGIILPTHLKTTATVGKTSIKYLDGYDDNMKDTTVPTGNKFETTAQLDYEINPILNSEDFKTPNLK